MTPNENNPTCGPNEADLPPGCKPVEFQFELGDVVSHKSNPTLPLVVERRFLDADSPPSPVSNLYLLAAMTEGGRMVVHTKEQELAAYTDRRGQVTKLLQQIIDRQQNSEGQWPAKAG